MEQLISALPDETLRRVNAGAKHFHWYANYEAANEAYHRRPGSDPNTVVAGFYDIRDGSVHVAGSVPIDHAHELAHAIDGQNDEITTSPSWQDAYTIERSSLVSEGADALAQALADAADAPDEWWAVLVSIAMTDRSRWKDIREKVPVSAGIIEEHVHAGKSDQAG